MRKRLIRTGIVAGCLLAVPALVFALWPVIAPSLVFMSKPLAQGMADPGRWGMGKAAKQVRIRTSDDLLLHGWWFSSQQRPSCGVVLYFHGNKGNLVSRAPLARSFTRQGLDVLLVDYRGYGASAGAPSEAGLYRDARAAYRYVVDVRKVPPEQIFLMGHSLGAAVATDVAVHHPSAGLVLISPFTSLAGATRAHVSWLPDRITQWGNLRFSTRDRIGHVTVPVLAVLGARDAFVPRSDAVALFRAAPQPKTWLEVAGHGHNDVMYSDEFGRTFETFRRRFGSPACRRRSGASVVNGSRS